MNILPELRRTFPIRYGSLHVDTGQDESLATGEQLSYYEDDRDWEHYFTYSLPGQGEDRKYQRSYGMDLSRFSLGGQVSLSADGRTALGQQYHKDGTASLVDLPLYRRFPARLTGFFERQGWLPMPEVLRLPKAATAFDLGPQGELSLALDQTVYHVHGGRLEPWKAFQDNIRDVEYLSDGSLAVVTEEKGKPGLNRFQFHLSEPGQTDTRVLRLSEVHPEEYSSDVLTRCKPLQFLSGATYQERERFLEQGHWLSTPSGYFKTHQTLTPNLVAVFDGQPRLWRFDRSSGKATAGPELELPRQPLDPTRQLRSLQEGRWVVQPGDSVPVWDGSTGRLAVVLPQVRDFQVTEEGRLSFQDPEGGQHSLLPEEAGSVKQQPWYLRAVAAELLDARAGARVDSGLKVLDGQLRVGSTLLKIRR